MHHEGTKVTKNGKGTLNLDFAFLRVLRATVVHLLTSIVPS
jgi:hypothetical protein